MTAAQQLKFVTWAVEHCPGFTLSRRGYTQARWNYRKFTRQGE